MPSNDLPQQYAPSPAPPPIQPVNIPPNPYDFITNSPTKPKRSLIPGGNSKIGKLLLVSAVALILLMIGVVVYSLLNSASTAQKADYVTLLKQQAEIIRISEIGTTKAKQTDAKNLAITTKYSLASQQSTTAELAKKAGASVDAKTLAASKNAKTDEILNNAEQSNNFDTEFIKILLASLQSYQQTIKKLYESSTSSSAKDALSRDYNAVNKLLGVQSKEGKSVDIPASN